MKQHNTLTLKQLLYRTAGSLFVMLVLFSLFIFKVIPGCSLTESKLIFLLLVLLSEGLIYFEKENRRNHLSVALNALIPFGIYTTLAYIDVLKVSLGLIWGILILLDLIYIGFYLYKIKNRDLLSLLEKTHILIGLASLLSLVVILSFTLFGSSILHSSVPSTRNSDAIIRQYDTKSLKNLKDWKTLTRKEKLNTLQTICNHERDYLGISSKIKVGAGSILTHPYAQYNHRSKEITIDLNQLDKASSQTLLEAVLHSTYHAYEYSLVDSYDMIGSHYKKLLEYRKIAIYKEELSTQVTNKAVNFNQINESDAKAYAAYALSDYQKEEKKLEK